MPPDPLEVCTFGAPRSAPDDHALHLKTKENKI